MIGARSIEARDSYAPVITAVLASIAGLMCSYPMEMVKVMKIIEHDRYGHLGTLDTFKVIYK